MNETFNFSIWNASVFCSRSLSLSSEEDTPAIHQPMFYEKTDQRLRRQSQRAQFFRALSDHWGWSIQSLTVNSPCPMLHRAAAASIYGHTLSPSSAPRIHSSAHRVLQFRFWSLQIQSRLRVEASLHCLCYRSPLCILPTEFTTLSANYCSLCPSCQLTRFQMLRVIYRINQSRRQTNTFKWHTIAKRKTGFRSCVAADFQALMGALYIT